MTFDRTSRPPDVGKAYLSAARNLKRSIERNRDDTDFAREREIRYIFDANVIIFHAYTKDRKRLTRNFDYLVGHDSPNELSRAMERLTADYLLSGNLPGQQHQQAFVSVPHFAEVLGWSGGIAKTIDSNFSREQQRMRRGEAEFNDRIAAIIRSDTTPARKLELLGEVVPAAWLNALNTSAQFTEAMHKAFLAEEPRLVALDNAEWARDSICLLRSDVDDWKQAILRASTGRDPAAVQDDAETLATVVNLCRDLQETGCRYLFVTADTVLVRVVNRRMRELRKEGIQDFIRTPQDYLPLLNINAMRLALGQQLSDEVRRRFQNVFNTLHAAVDWLEVAWSDQDLADLFATTRPLSELQQAWTEASRYVTVLNASHMAESAPGIFRDIESFVTRGEGAKAATDRVRDTVEAVRERHLNIIVGIALSALRNLRSGTDEHPQRRVEIQLLGHLFGPLMPPGVGINALLDEAVEKAKLPGNTLEHLRISPQRRESQLLVASLFVGAARWGAAAQFAARAYTMAPFESEFRAEAAYLLALSLRFAMRTASEYERARKLLVDNRKLYRRRPRSTSTTLRRLRDEVELSTLMLTAAVTQELAVRRRRPSRRPGNAKPTFLNIDTPAETFCAGIAMIREAYETLLDSEPFDASSSPFGRAELARFVRSLKRQAIINLVGAFVFEQTAPGLQLRKAALAPEHIPLQELEILNKEREAAGLARRPTMYIYWLVGSALCEARPDTRLSILKDADAYICGLDLGSGVLPFSDEVEFDFLGQYVKAEIEDLEAAV